MSFEGVGCPASKAELIEWMGQWIKEADSIVRDFNEEQSQGLFQKAYDLIDQEEESRFRAGLGESHQDDRPSIMETVKDTIEFATKVHDDFPGIMRALKFDVLSESQGKRFRHCGEQAKDLARSLSLVRSSIPQGPLYDMGCRMGDFCSNLIVILNIDIKEYVNMDNSPVINDNSVHNNISDSTINAPVQQGKNNQIQQSVNIDYGEASDLAETLEEYVVSMSQSSNVPAETQTQLNDIQKQITDLKNDINAKKDQGPIKSMFSKLGKAFENIAGAVTGSVCKALANDAVSKISEFLGL